MDERKRLLVKIRLRVAAQTYGVLALLLTLFAGIACAEILLTENQRAKHAVRDAMRAESATDDDEPTRLPAQPFSGNPSFADFRNGRRS